MPISVESPVSGLAAPLRAIVRAALAQEGLRAGEVGIVIATDAELRALNRRWRGIDRATDVLSFEYARDRGRVSGDLVISLDRVAEQAARFRVSRGRELARLAVHGALHLAGHDHARPAERARMRSRESRALRACAAPARRLDAALTPRAAAPAPRRRPRSRAAAASATARRRSR